MIITLYTVHFLYFLKQTYKKTIYYEIKEILFIYY